MKRLRVLFLSLLFPIAFLSTLIVPSVASAAPMHTSQARFVLIGTSKTAMRAKSAMATYTCGTNCNGENPQGTSCAQGAQTILSAYIVDPRTGGNWGIVELRWSPTCGTNWTRVTSYMGTQQLYATIEHPVGVDGGHAYYTSQIQHTIQTWTPMIYSPDDPVVSVANITVGGVQHSACVVNPPLSC